MATSRFENLRAGLATAFTTQLGSDGLSSVKVHKYRPVNTTREHIVYVGNISGSQEPFTQSDGFRLEEMDVEVAVRCPTFGTTTDEFATVEQVAESVMASIEKAVRNDITVGGVVFNVEFSSYETDHTFDGDGAVGVVDIVLTAEAHI